MKTGILGGTFNPVHNGHIYIAKKALEKLELDYLFFIPDNIPPHKDFTPEVSNADRLAMINIAVNGEEKFKVLDIELKRGGISYTIDTVKEIINTYHPEKIFLVVGADLVSDLNTWKEIDSLKNIADFVVFNRDGKSGKEYMKQYPFIKILDIQEYNASSTEIRKMVKTGEKIDKLVPAGVANYIYEKKLYLI